MIDGLTVLAGLADRIGQTVRCWSWTRSAALPPCVSMLGKEKVEGPSDPEQQCLTILPSILSSLLVAERDGPARVVVIVRHHYLASRRHGWQLRCAKAAR